MWSLLQEHWQDAAKLLGFGGTLAGAWKFLPRAYRFVVSLLAAKVLLDIEIQKTKAREEQVADLLEIIEGKAKGKPP